MDLIINKHRLRFSKNPKLLSPEKKTIIFLHDSLGCIELWKDFPKHIASKTDCNILSYDRLGYGKSAPFITSKRNNDYLKEEAYILGEIIQKLELKNIILFGHSDGGSIALLTAALFPEKVIGIITEGAHVFVEEETINGIKSAVLAYQNTSLKEKLYKYHGNKTDAVFRMWTETWLSETFQSWNIEKYLPKIECPSLIIQGEKDEYGTLDQINSIIKNTSGNSKALLIPDSGHTPHKENAKIVIDKVSRFISRLIVSC
ncbi:pimeloyl-ACP methyl ester carboxylesterase [Aquimarina sp. MAR_2010_214]|uniref:alpha/beta fold hydrolase n=1 Tax=Aquimarina sp. MAR_2010_214 TaxID=1250026 RepID=UPI000CBE6BFE|nr:alpha/beta hydrolase [Aquimarina sp. MAR_2010_214]PKV51065.1 pimeloyl-ACP methyl ester carboxylesterase [Aquimarina sp. MAR_2010_214]